MVDKPVTPSSPSLSDLVTDVLAACRARGLKLATAESCTGGLIVGCLTAISGSSEVVDRGFVTYSNAAKTDMLGVPADLILTHGAVSEPVARAMARGALVRSMADIAVAVTGIAGPTGGSDDKPVGLVHLAAARRSGGIRHRREVYGGDRSDVREQTVATALEMILELAEEAA